MCKHYGKALPEDHRHFIASLPHENCLLCLVEAEGPMTQEQVAGYIGVSKERIHQIEKQALKKIRASIQFKLEDVVSDPVRSFTPKSVLLGRSGIVSYTDVRPQFFSDESTDLSWRGKCIPK